MSLDLRATPTRGAIRRLAAVLAAASLAAGCAAPDTTTGPRAAVGASADRSGSGVGDRVPPGVLRCAVSPGAPTRSDTETIGSEGGRLVVDGTSVTIPAGAVRSPETFTLTVRARREVGLEVRASGYEHFVFDAPVDVTIDFSRCGDLGSGNASSLLAALFGGAGGPSLHGWYVDDETGEPLEDMGGTTDFAALTHTFRTDHFSNYLLAE